MTTPLHLTPIILAGGSGTRLWPLSREEYPKQLLHLTGANTLLQETVMRLDGLTSENGTDGQPIEVNPAIIACHEDHRFHTLEQLAAVDHTPKRIILEPFGRNTAPALTAAALSAREDGADPTLLVMPADHVIARIAPFHRAVAAGAHLAQEQLIITFGIVPSRPETGYGYIRTGAVLREGNGDASAYAIDAFVEKPDAATAETYLAAGDHLWNSGMFLMRASVWLEAIDRHRPDILSACEAAVAEGADDGRFFRVDKARFEACPSDSIDYAVMEPLTLANAQHGQGGAAIASAVIPLDAGWSDIGSWHALLELEEVKDEDNVVQGDVFTHDTAGSLLIAKEHLLATVGVKDLVVVETADAVLVADKHRSQDVRKVVDWLKESGRGESKTHRRVYRPWGDFEQIDTGDRYKVKRLTVKPGEALSLQLHHHRAEHWVVVRGEAKVTRGRDTLYLQENESTFIPIGVKHRLENPGTELLEVIEVQSGAYLEEDDIVRFEDRYDRN